MKKLATCLLACAFVLLTGCATIVGSDSQTMNITSTPDKADIKIVDEAGQQAFAGTTPATVILAKSSGHYFGGKTYTVTVSKDGFASQVIIIEHHANGWYLFGNIMLGGIIGYVVVDPFHGGMYTLSPSAVNASLSPEQKTVFSYKGDELRVALLQDIPASLRSQLVPIKVPSGT